MPISYTNSAASRQVTGNAFGWLFCAGLVVRAHTPLRRT